MSLRLIYGRAGTGKSTIIFNEVKEKIKENSKKYIITPEQFSYSAEKNLLKTLGKKSVINAEIITFKRMAERIAEEVGGKIEATLTKSGKAMIIYSILEKEKENLKFLKSSESNVELSMQIIKEFKKYKINEEEIKEIQKSTDSLLLRTKLEDIKLIYSQYQQYIKKKYIDEEDILTKLEGRIEQSHIFDNSEIYIDEFSGFTKQEYDIIKQLLKKAKCITVAFCMDNLNKGQLETDIFYSSKQSANKLIDIANELKIKIEEPIILKNSHKFKTKELKHLEQNIYNIPYKTYQEKPENIKIIVATNPYNEIEEVAKTIIKLIRDENIKYSDIAIITKNIEEYSSIVKAIFKKNDIPIFIDKKNDLSKSQIIKYILSILEIFSKNWSQEAVISYIKSGFLPLEQNEIYKIENYTNKWGIKGNKWYKQDWEYEEENPNETREKIVQPLLKLKKELEGKKTARNISKIIYKFLEENNIIEQVETNINTYQEKEEIIVANNYKTSFEILIDLIDEIISIYDNEKITFEKYRELLKVGLSYKELGNIPEVIDQVILGDTERTRSQQKKVVFIIGVNDGVFSGINKNEGFLNDKERENLKAIGKEIAKGSLELLYEEQFEIYKALTIPEKRIYLLFTSTDKDGKTLRPSILISKIKKIFPLLKEESKIFGKKAEITSKEMTFQELLKNLQKAKNEEKIEDIWYEIYNWYKQNSIWNKRLGKAITALNYNNKSEKITKENIKKLYGEKLKTSISKLETYRKCPFSFHLKYGLKLKEKEEFKIKTIDTGSFMHEIVDEFFKQISDINQLKNSEIPNIVENIIEEKLNLKKNSLFTSNKKFLVLTNRLKKIVIQSIEYIVYQLKNSNFEVLSNELEFTKTINNVELVGKIDRVDISKDGEYIRVIDYKSSTKNINLNEVLSGVQIQLFTYMDIIAEKQNKTPAGVLYFNLIEPIISSSKDLEEEEIKEKIKNEFRMKGIVLADIKVIKMMDKNLSKGSSDIIPVYIDSTGNINKIKSSAITKEEFSKLQKSIRKIVEEISNEILSGNIDIKPMYNKRTKETGCKYCEYKTICGFNPKINGYSYIENKTREELLNKINI